MSKPTKDQILDFLGFVLPGIPAYFTLPGWAAGVVSFATYLVGKAARKGVPFVREPSVSTPLGEDNEDPIPPSKRKPSALLVLVAAGLMAQGCATFAASRDACLAGTETHNRAIQMVVPHLAKAMTCAAENVTNDDAAIMCVQNEFESLKTEAEPIVYACALALIGDVVQAKK